MKLNKKQARNFILTHQKLMPPRKLEGKRDILEYIKKVGCIQFDPLNVIAYNPYLVLQSRVRNFKGKYLQELLYNDRKLIDGWDKNMSIYSVEDWPLFKRYRDKAFERHGNELSPIYNIIQQVRESLKKNGPLTSKDLKLDDKVRWSWAPTRAGRAALESMYFWGELIIHNKIGTRKVYDFSEKHLPSEILSTPDPNKTMEQYFNWIVKRRIGAIGLLWKRSSDAWLGVDAMKTNERNKAMTSLEAKGELVEIEIEDIDYPFYIRREEQELLNKVLGDIKVEPQVSFIAPLDNLLWDRKLIKDLFGFEYKWEVYTPVNKRRYGYYVLPILYGNKFIGRFEPKYHKKTRILEIMNWWWEADMDLEEFKQPLIDCIKQFTDFLGATSISFKDNSKTPENLDWLQKIL